MKRIIIFGASGDLAKRKIMPALSKVIQNDTEVYAYARSDLKEKYSSLLRECFSYSTDFPEKVKYISGPYDNLDVLKGIIDSDTVIYFSLPPHVYLTLFAELSKFNYGIVCIEKPYGNDYKSFKELQKYVGNKVCCIDHYLLKPMILSLFKIQMENLELFNFLSSENINEVECYFKESILAEGRSHFDKNGIIKDVMQNHLIEVIASILSEKHSENYSAERLEFIKKMKIDDKNYVFGQYKTYCNEMDVKSNTETFASFKCSVDSEKWKNVPFLLAAGKGLSKKATEIIFNVKKESFQKAAKLFLKNSSHSVEKLDEMKIVFNIAPENRIYIQFGHRADSHTHDIFTSENISVERPEAYENIFNSLIRNSYFPIISCAEADILWTLFEHIHSHPKSLIYYTIGIEILKEAKDLLKK
jgi:glucose-6-phosphate 1-dehydrogenase